MYKNLIFEETNDNIGIITINRPKALNALNPEVLSELLDLLTKIKSEGKLNSIILTGAGRSFVAGADIATMSDLDPVNGREMIKLGHTVMALIEDIEIPVIAAVNGFALGGGCELAMACDIRVASTKAVFGQPEVKLGIIPGFGGTQRLSRLVGKGMAKYLIFSGANIKADEAYRINLVEKLVAPDELMDAALKLVREINENAPIAVGTAKKAIDIGYDLPMKTAIQLEIETFTVAFASKDKEEGMKAFLEKRKPNFENE